MAPVPEGARNPAGVVRADGARAWRRRAHRQVAQGARLARMQRGRARS